jgi:MoxR-like ATPase
MQPTIQAPAPVATLQAIESELCREFLEREDQVRGLLTALLSNQHLLLIGPPGTAKSALVTATVGSLTGARIFSWLMTRFSTPEELFGPISLAGLEQDQYRRLTTGKMSEAHVAFLTEIWKANSAILNALLTLCNERIFYNDGQPVACPLLTLVGDSNELPQGDDLGALFDRFALRYTTDYLTDGGFARLLASGPMSGAGTTRTTLSLADLSALQAAAATLPLPQSVLDALVTLRSELRGEGVIASDRRWRQSLSLLRAHALLEGRAAVEEDDLSILQHALWQTPEQQKVVGKAVARRANPLNAKAVEIFDRAKSAFEAAQAAAASEPDKAPTVAIEAHTKLKAALDELDKLAETAAAAGRSTARVEAAREKVNTMNRYVVTKMMGVRL